MTDPIADMLTRMRNALAVKKPEVVLPFSKIKMNIAQILKKQGYIISAEEIQEPGLSKQLKIVLKYNGKEPAITNLKRISKPGHRKYTTKDELPVVLNSLGIAIISTSRGMMTNKEAKKQNLGGEIICEVF